MSVEGGIGDSWAAKQKGSCDISFDSAARASPANKKRGKLLWAQRLNR